MRQKHIVEKFTFFFIILLDSTQDKGFKTGPNYAVVIYAHAHVT